MRVLQQLLATALDIIVLGLILSGCQQPVAPIVEGGFPLEEKWHFEADQDIAAELGVGKGLIAVRTTQKIYMLDALTGALLWTVELPLGMFDISPTPPLIGDNEVVIGYLEGVQTLDIATGQVRWKSQNTGCPGAAFPVASNDAMVYVVRYNCNAQAYDRITGAMVWSISLGGRGAANLFLDQNKIYLVGPNRLLRVLDSATGALIEESKDQIDFPATYQLGMLYGFKGNALVAFDVSSGKALWENRGTSTTGPPTAIGQKILVSAYDGYPKAFDARTGKLLWTAATSRGRYQTLAVLDDTAYAREIFSGKIYALALRDGADLGHLLTGNRSVISDWSYTWRPVTTESLLIVPMGRKVYAYGN